MAGFRGQRSSALASVEVENGLYGFEWRFWLNSLDQPQFQPQIWPLTSFKAKKRSVFIVFAFLMAMSYMVFFQALPEQIKIFIFWKVKSTFQTTSKMIFSNLKQIFNFKDYGLTFRIYCTYTQENYKKFLHTWNNATSVKTYGQILAEFTAKEAQNFPKY